MVCAKKGDEPIEIIHSMNNKLASVPPVIIYLFIYNRRWGAGGVM